MVAQFSEPVLQKSKYSDALYCSKVCINTSDLYQQDLKRKADGMLHVDNYIILSVNRAGM